MRFAIPLADGRLCAHFGHCQSFALIDADTESGKILARGEVDAPPTNRACCQVGSPNEARTLSSRAGWVDELRVCLLNKESM